MKFLVCGASLGAEAAGLDRPLARKSQRSANDLNLGFPQQLIEVAAARQIGNTRHEQIYRSHSP